MNELGETAPLIPSPPVRRAETCPFEAVGPFVVVEIEREKEVTKGGILRPDQSRDILAVGTIVAVGEDVRYLKVGDRVPFQRHAGQPFEWGGRLYRFTIQDELPVRLVPGVEVEEVPVQ